MMAKRVPWPGERSLARLGFGAMRLTGPRAWGSGGDREHAIRVLRVAVDSGVDLIDTADAYGPHINEEQIRDALWPYHDDLVIASKGGIERPDPEHWVPNGRPDYLQRALEASLRRLGLNCMPLYQLHRSDPDVPLDESLGALADLQRAGKIRHLGICNVTAAQVGQALATAKVVTVQNQLSLADVAAWESMHEAERRGLVFIAHSPLAEGALASMNGRLAEPARSARATPAQVALAWLLRQSPQLVAIPGSADPDHVRANMKTMELFL